MRHVIQEHGATVLNFISGPLANPEALTRYNAFRKVMDENRLRIDPRRIYYGTFRQQDGKAAIEEFALSGMKLPDAFICANDAMALTAVSALEKLGYRVPMTLSLPVLTVHTMQETSHRRLRLLSVRSQWQARQPVPLSRKFSAATIPRRSSRSMLTPYSLKAAAARTQVPMTSSSTRRTHTITLKA